MHRDTSMSNIHLAPPLNDAMEEDRRDATSPGRRSTDGEIVRAADAAIAMRWRWWQMIVYILGVGFLAGMFYFQSSADQKSTAEMRAQLTQIDSKLNTMALSNLGRDKDIEFLKTRVEEAKREAISSADMLEARIIVLEKAIAKLEARN